VPPSVPWLLVFRVRSAPTLGLVAVGCLTGASGREREVYVLLARNQAHFRKEVASPSEGDGEFVTLRQSGAEIKRLGSLLIRSENDEIR